MVLPRLQQRAALACSVHVPEGVALSEPTGTALFRVLQEALTNVARHARARQVEVRLELEPAGAVLSVRDDGVGLAEGVPWGLGLLGMQERIRTVRRARGIESVAGSGTTVRARVPA